MSPWLLDGLVIAGYFILILWVGLYMGRKEESFGDFALGGRSIPWWAVLASIIAAETSAATFIGTPGEGFASRNFIYVQLAVGTILARIIVAYLFIKAYYDHNVYSIYELLTTRFGTRSKNAASALFLITRVLASGARLYVAAVILVLGYEMIAGVHPTQQQELGIYTGAIIAVSVITAIYTTFGGIKAVIWTDLIQATIMMGSALAAIWMLYRHIPGGWATISAKLQIQGIADVKIFDLGTKPGLGFWGNLKGILESEYTLWAILGSTFTTMATHGTDQDMVQRMLTAPDVKRSRRSLITSGLADIPIVMIFLTVGILLWVFFQTNPDPNLPTKTNEIFCYYILHQMSPGMRGLLIAGIFATAMGSLSAALNALATSFTRDWYVPFINPEANEHRMLCAVRVATVVFGLLMILVGSATAYLVILNPLLRIIPIVLGIAGYTYGSLLGIFLVGVLTKNRGNDWGNMFAMTIGFILVAFLSGLPNEVAQICGTKLYDQPAWLPIVEFPWRVMFGAIATFLVAICFKTKTQN